MPAITYTCITLSNVDDTVEAGLDSLVKFSHILNAVVIVWTCYNSMA
jgi:hypothetical protein